MLVKSEGFCVPHAWMALSWERNARTVIDLSRLSFRSLSRFTNCRAADLPLSVRVKNRNSLGSLKVSVALMLSRIVPESNLADADTTGRSGTREDDLANELRFLLRDHLRDEAAQRESKEINLIEPQGTDKGDRIVGHGGHGVRRLAFRSADTAVVESDHWMLGGDAVDDPWIPVV